jgi:hypothetical protein
MNQTPLNNLLAAAALIGVIATAGCLQTHGNRRGGAPMITRVSELRGMIGKRVTLVGTAREDVAGGAALALRDGTVQLPAYDWPAGSADRAVTLIGTVIDQVTVRRQDGGRSRVYRVGDVELVERWSR